MILFGITINKNPKTYAKLEDCIKKIINLFSEATLDQPVY